MMCYNSGSIHGRVSSERSPMANFLPIYISNMINEKTQYKSGQICNANERICLTHSPTKILTVLGFQNLFKNMNDP